VVQQRQEREQYRGPHGNRVWESGVQRNRKPRETDAHQKKIQVLHSADTTGPGLLGRAAPVPMRRHPSA
jgi:hypothetical protein